MNAGQKWLHLFIDIATYEFDHSSDGQLLSEAADRLIMKHPIAGRLLIVATGAIITLHLSNLIDDRYDIMSTQFWRAIKGR